MFIWPKSGYQDGDSWDILHFKVRIPIPCNLFITLIYKLFSISILVNTCLDTIDIKELHEKAIENLQNEAYAILNNMLLK